MKYITKINCKFHKNLEQLIAKSINLTIVTLGLLYGISYFEPAKAHKVCEFKFYAETGAQNFWILENDFETTRFIIEADGRWSAGSEIPLHGPNGAYRDIRYPSRLRYPDESKVGALLMNRSSRNSYEFIGDFKEIRLRDGEQIRFAFNDVPGSDRNNPGYVIVAIHADDYHEATASNYRDCS